MEKLKSKSDVEARVMGHYRKRKDVPPECHNYIFDDNVYILTDEEVKWLEGMHDLSKRPLGVINIPDTEFDNGIIGILKENIEKLEELRDKVSAPLDQAEDVVAISQQINITVSNLMTAYKEAGITQQEE